MISQGPFTEIERMDISNRKMISAYGISMKDFLSLPEEFQNALIFHHWQILRKNENQLRDKANNNTYVSMSDAENKKQLDDKISSVAVKKKILSIFKKNK